jgi:hypothetical protein
VPPSEITEEKPIPSPAVLGQVTGKFRDAVKGLAEQQRIPIYQFNHQERKDDVANRFRRKRGTRDGIVFIGVAQEKARAFQGNKVDGQFLFTRDKTVYVNHYYFYIDDADFGPLFIKGDLAGIHLNIILQTHLFGLQDIDRFIDLLDLQHFKFQPVIKLFKGGC